MLIGSNTLKAFGSIRILIQYIFLILFFSVTISVLLPILLKRLNADFDLSKFRPIYEISALFLGTLAAGIFVFHSIKRYFPAPSIKGSFAEVGLVKCSTSIAISAAGCGFFLAIFFARFLSDLYPADKDFVANPLAQIAQTSTYLQIFLLFISVCMAPIVEECLFRGVLYSGFAMSWGKLISAVVVTTAFVLLHYRNFGEYWVAAAALISISVVLIAVRESTNSLIPPILLHQFYNFGLGLPI